MIDLTESRTLLDEFVRESDLSPCCGGGEEALEIAWEEHVDVSIGGGYL